MEPEKFKALMASMILTILAGNLEQRISYCGIVVDHLFYYVKTEKLMKDTPAILNLRNQLCAAFDVIAAGKIDPDRADNEEYRRWVSENFRSYFIVLTDTPEMHNNVQTIQQLELLKAARESYARSSEFYGEYLSGSREGLASCLVEISSVIRIITQIAYDLDLISIEDMQWQKAAARPQPEPRIGGA